MPRTLKVNGYDVLIDEEDYPKLVTWGFSVRLSGVSQTPRLIATRGEFRGKQISRLLLGVTEVLVDHANGNTLDTTKLNLRPATHSQNSANKTSPVWKSLPKGVTARRGKFQANIEIEGITKYLGEFDTVSEAENKYKEFAERLHGDYALHNRPL